jgi:hypothetical protein
MNKANWRLTIIVLTLFTAVVHLLLGIAQVAGGMMGGVMFLLNTAGFLGLLALLLGWLPFSVPVLSDNKDLQYYTFIAFSALTIVAYFAVNGGQSFSNPVGLVTKTVEALLIISLWMHKQAT